MTYIIVVVIASSLLKVGDDIPVCNLSLITIITIKEALSLGCDSRRHHSRVLRRCRSSRTRRGGGNGCHQKMPELAYSELSTAYLFLPIAVVTLSPMNDSAHDFCDSQEVSFLFQKLSVIQKLNAALFRDTFTLHDDPDL